MYDIKTRVKTSAKIKHVFPALNYLPIVPKASICVPKVMRKPVMDANDVFSIAKLEKSDRDICLDEHTSCACINIYSLQDWHRRRRSTETPSKIYISYAKHNFHAPSLIFDRNTYTHLPNKNAHPANIQL